MSGQKFWELLFECSLGNFNITFQSEGQRKLIIFIEFYVNVRVLRPRHTIR